MKADIPVLCAALLCCGAAEAQSQTPAPAQAPTTVADVLKAASDAEQAGDEGTAIKYYDAIIQQFPKEFPEVYARRASDRSLMHDEKGAVADYTKALALDNALPAKDQVLNHGPIYRDRAAAKRFSGDVKGAIADYHLALKDSPGDSFTIADMAETELDLEDCAGANQAYSQAIALADKPEVLYFENRAVARLCLGDIANSYSDYQAAVALDLKGDPQPVLFGQLYLDAWALGVRLGRKDDADKALAAQLAATKQEDGSLERDLGSYFIGKADLALVMQDADKYNKDNGSDETWMGFAYYAIGLKQMGDGDDKAAIASFQKLLSARKHFVNTQLEARSWIRLMTPAKK